MLISLFVAPVLLAQTVYANLETMSDPDKIIYFNNIADSNQSNPAQWYYDANQALTLLKRYPNKEQAVRAHMHMARIGLLMQEYNFAEMHAKLALDNATENQEKYLVFQILGQIAYEKGELTTALKYFTTTANLATTTEEKYQVWLLLSQMYLNTNKLDDAIRVLDPMLKLNATKTSEQEATIHSYILLGQIFWQQKQPGKAGVAWQKAYDMAQKYEIENYNDSIFYHLAQLNLNFNDIKTALFYAQKALLSNEMYDHIPLRIDIMELIAQIFMKINKQDQAFRMLSLKYDTSLSNLRKYKNQDLLFLKNSIEVNDLKKSVVSLQEKLKISYLFISLVIFTMFLIIVIVIIISVKWQHTKSNYHALSLSYKSLKHKFTIYELDISEKINLYENQSIPYGLIVGNIKNYKILEKKYQNIALEFTKIRCADDIIDKIADSMLVSPNKYKNLFFILWPCTIDKYNQTQASLPALDYEINLPWKSQGLLAQVHLDIYHSTQINSQELHLLLHSHQQTVDI